jgi:hypothetical protein
MEHEGSGYRHLPLLRNGEGGNRRNRRVPVTTDPRVVVRTAHVFFAAEEPVPLRYTRLFEAVFPWLPRPHPLLMERVNAFRQDSLPPRTVGVHIRRTDLLAATTRSPDEAYFRETDRLIDDGYTTFLATDNLASLQTMQQRYGDRLVHYPKASEMAERWPRAVSRSEDVADDIIDLWLLAACNFVIGSSLSSYSRLAIVLNGSDSCKALDRPLATLRDPVSRLWREYVARPARSVNPPGTTY